MIPEGFLSAAEDPGREFGGIVVSNRGRELKLGTEDWMAGAPDTGHKPFGIV